MPLKKWLLQYSFAFPLLFLILAGVQYLKGHTVIYSMEFGLLWTAISIIVFALRRAYFFRKKINCQLCNDLPANNTQKK
ncbi:SoxR reducing system RseC family protein [Alteromonas ponticola]|uniref:SoxR reducing system RseC family protein n=1 Tax=Alteromonas aquimaris TaxID=2998417 RepID=A0ABT3P9G5_9ALTE|nr:hypothetical protein [Alteromonas aquimaris]MCW8108721.1 SoxR reducing system RseC family protein [Alteromonas aquimaris]